MLGFTTIREVKEMHRLITQCQKESDVNYPMLCPTINPTDRSANNIEMFGNLIEYISKHPKCTTLLNDLETIGYLGTQNRKLFVNACVELLVEEGVKQGFKKNYPPVAMKIELARTIVETFPVLKCNLEGTSGYGHFYDPAGTGYIENRLKTIRKRMPLDSKAYKKRGEKRSYSSSSMSDSIESDQSFSTASTVDVRDHDDMIPMKEKILWLKQTVPTAKNLPAIYEAMKSTLDYRRLDIENDNMTLTDLLEKYPRFRDVDHGSLIEHEFELLQPNCKKFMDIFPPLVKGVNKLDNSIVCEDDELRAILVLIKLLPSLNTNGRKEGYGAVIVFKGAGCNVEQYAETKGVLLKQPYLLAVGQQSKPEQYYLILDKIPVPVGNKSLAAIYRLFATFWIFGVQYYEKLSTFYNFFEVLIMSKKPHCSVASIIAAIM